MSNKKTRPFVRKSWMQICLSLILSFLLVLSVAKSYPARQIETGVSLQTFSSHLDMRIPDLMRAYQIPGVSIVLIKDGKIVWSNAYGYADIEKGLSMTTDTICRVQSISKPVTAWGVMRLVEQGKIDLDKPVSYYLHDWRLPESEFPQEKMTVRQLLSHTAGMPLGDILTRFSPQEDMPSLTDKLTMEARLTREPGASFSYSNTGYNLLELLIEEVTDLGFSAYMEQEILIPLEMNESSFAWSELFDPPVPKGYNLKGEEIPVYVYPEKASGGLLATAGNIARFVLAGMSDYRKDILSAESISHLYTPMAKDLGLYSLVFDAYGLGYYIEYLSGGQLSVSHGGQGTGWMTHFHAVPKMGAAIVILTNSQRSWPFIAYLLSDWTAWHGISSVGMETILTGQKILWGVIGLIWFAIILQLIKLAEGLISKKRRFAPFSTDFRFTRAVKFALFIVLSTVLIWCISQPYLNITSIFPQASEWLGICVFVLTLTLFISACFPARARRN